MATDRPNQTGVDEKIVGIELLRFACAVAVLVFHYQHFAYGGQTTVPFVATDQPFFQPLKLLYLQGFYGVQIFWCISGFIFFWKYGQVIAQHRMTGRKFFVLRLSRLYPLHLITLLFMAIMQLIYAARAGGWFEYQHNDAWHFFLQLFMASNWGLQSGDSFNGPIWSISVEVLVYAIFFLSLRYVSGSVAFLAAVAAGAAAVQLLKISSSQVVVCLMFFYLGCLTAVAYLRFRDSPARNRLVTLLAAAAVVASSAGGILFELKAKYVLVLLVPSLIYLCVRYIPSTGTAARLLVPAGNMTYSSYLLHVPLQILVVTCCLYTGTKLPIGSPVLFLAYMVITLALSAWSYKYVEMPAQTWLRRHFMARTPAPVRSLS